jgi:uncharacterized protein (DUF58 family)
MQRLYILPTRHGFVFLAIIILMILVAASSGNNLIYMLGFCLLSIYMFAMVLTNLNLKGLEFEIIEVSDGFAGEAAHVRIGVSNRENRPRYFLETKWKISKTIEVNTIKPKGQTIITQVLKIDARGVYELPPLRVSTIYPLGLFRAWSVLRLKTSVYIYPQRKGERQLRATSALIGSGPQSANQFFDQHDDFREHSRFQLGESHNHVDWKAFARRGELLTKKYQTNSPHHFVLNWQSVSDLGMEDGLCQLAHWLEDLRTGDQSFEMRLPDCQIGSGKGFKHGETCLRELAKFTGVKP